jgi:enoyl-CoA hydratase/carnithine racemase
MDQAVRWRRSDKLGHLAFCRSSKRNALRMADWAKLSDMLEAISTAGVQALIIESSDSQVFSAGSDLVEVEALSKEPDDAAPFALAMQRVGDVVTVHTVHPQQSAFSSPFSRQHRLARHSEPTNARPQ